MKVLVDTCIWSLALRRKNAIQRTLAQQAQVDQLTEAIHDGNVVMLGPIRQEVLSGIKDESQFERIARLLDPFPDEDLRTEDYLRAARFFNLCRKDGVQCGPIDMQICSIAAARKYVVLTNDGGLLRCLEVLRKRHGAIHS